MMLPTNNIKRKRYAIAASRLALIAVHSIMYFFAFANILQARAEVVSSGPSTTIHDADNRLPMFSISIGWAGTFSTPEELRLASIANALIFSHAPIVANAPARDALARLGIQYLPRRELLFGIGGTLNIPSSRRQEASEVLRTIIDALIDSTSGSNAETVLRSASEPRTAVSDHFLDVAGTCFNALFPEVGGHFELSPRVVLSNTLPKSIGDAFRLLQRRLGANNLYLSFAGDITTDAAREFTRVAFSGLPILTAISPDLTVTSHPASDVVLHRWGSYFDMANIAFVIKADSNSKLSYLEIARFRLLDALRLPEVSQLVAQDLRNWSFISEMQITPTDRMLLISLPLSRTSNIAALMNVINRIKTSTFGEAPTVVNVTHARNRWAQRMSAPPSFIASERYWQFRAGWREALVAWGAIGSDFPAVLGEGGLEVVSPVRSCVQIDERTNK